MMPLGSGSMQLSTSVETSSQRCSCISEKLLNFSDMGAPACRTCELSKHGIPPRVPKPDGDGGDTNYVLGFFISSGL